MTGVPRDCCDMATDTDKGGPGDESLVARTGTSSAATLHSDRWLSVGDGDEGDEDQEAKSLTGAGFCGARGRT